MAKIGDKVVCIRTHSEALVVKGKIYTVFDITKCPTCGQAFYRLEELPPDIGTHCDKCFRVVSHGYNVFSTWLFRPIDYPKLSYSDIAKQNVEERLDIPVKHSVPAKQH